jgi:hypothetical protein
MIGFLNPEILPFLRGLGPLFSLLPPKNKQYQRKQQNRHVSPLNKGGEPCVGLDIVFKDALLE